MTMDGFSIQLNGEQVPIEIVKKRRKTLVLRIFPDSGRVLLSAPLNTPTDYIRDFVTKREDWLRKQLLNILPNIKQYQFVDEEMFYYQGRPLSLKVLSGIRNQALIVGDTIELSLKEALSAEKRRTVLETMFVREMKLASGQSLLRMLSIYAPLLELDFIPELKVRRMTSRWGSCRPQKHSITLSGKLIHLPLELLDYIVAHELCHFRQFNHGKGFWQLLAAGMPDWRERKGRLEQEALQKVF